MYICIGLRPRIAYPNYDMVGFQPHKSAIADLDSVCPQAFFKPNDKVLQKNISTECELYTTFITIYRYEQGTDMHGHK